MAATRSRPRTATGNGVAVKAKDAGGSMASAARRARGPLLATGAAAAGLAGGVAIGTRIGRRPQPRTCAGRRRAARRLGGEPGVEHRRRHPHACASSSRRLNRRSPVEVLLDGLTHRRGAHRSET